jgi:hypothetical protein
MSGYVIETPSNQMVCKCEFLFQIKLHKSEDLSNQMKKQVKKLRIGEAITFPNGLKVINVTDQMVTNMKAYIKRQKINKGRKNDSSNSSL